MQLDFGALDGGVPALAVPVAEDDPSCGGLRVRAGFGQFVDRRAVRVAVYDSRAAARFDQVVDGFSVDIHDFAGLAARGCLALLPGAVGPGLAFGERAGEEIPLPGGIADHCAELLVVEVIGAEHVAVQEQPVAALDVQPVWLLDQPGATALCVLLAEQEIAVAVHEVDACPAPGDRAQGIGDELRKPRWRIVADPQFEQVAEDEQVGAASGKGGSEVDKGASDVRARVLQMQVGNQDDFGIGHGACGVQSPSGSTVADSMTISSTGTSR